ncbi:TetR/AcrR family transcriptional regulator [Saccharomonospora sp. NB11]|jgi:AcrR family transcriptional regulator|uniref:TetR/AcrR family transcriptional regulator n=1 Tax=Saccharomonospora sp. NB11 TaxID=1642298 RepID=UPI0018D0F55B|nr:TetR/AcrR family transcriptional regulator [Saccharomonospora sp. NB11]
MTQQLGTPRRRDALSNRAAILRAAATAFSERGRAVDVREIARCAGVGMGTLYRHFPSKDALVETLLAESYAQWVASARTSARSRPTAWDALATFITEALTHQRQDRALLENLASATTDPGGLSVCRRSLGPLVTELVSAAHAEGTLRPGVTAEDVLGLLAALGKLVELDLPADAVSRCLDITLAGLRHGPPLDP